MLQWGRYEDLIRIVPYSYLQFSVVNIFVHLILYINYSSIAERKIHLSLIFTYVNLLVLGT
jgi:hypothetical protein